MRKVGKSISLLLMMMGLVILAYSLYAKWEVHQTQTKMSKDWESLNAAYASGETAGQKQYADGEIQVENKQDISIEDLKQEARQQIEETGMLGKITIPKIDLEAMVVPGVDQESIKDAVGWMPSTALPGENGNVALAGHRSYTYGQFFNRLDEIEVGDTFSIETPSQKYTYEVFDTKVVEPTNLSVLEQPKNDSIVTLITCTPMYSDEYRLIVQAREK